MEDFRLPVGRASPLLEEASLEEIERINVGVAQADGFRQDGLAFEQSDRAGDLKHAANAALIFFLDTAEDACSARDSRSNQGGVTAGDVEVGFSQGGFRVVDQDGEERPALVHPAQQVKSIGGVIRDEFFVAHSRGHTRREGDGGIASRQRPREWRASRQVVGVETPAGARPEPDAFDEVDRCSLAKVRHEPRRFVDELTIEGAAAGGEFLGVLFPLRNLIRLDPPEVQQDARAAPR